MKNKWFAFALIFELLIFCSVSQGTTVTHNDGLGGDAQARLDSSDTAATLNGLFPDAPSPNHLFENSWFYRLPGGDTEIQLTGTAVSGPANVITISGAVQEFFTWNLVPTLLHKPTANAASVDMTLTVTNTSTQGAFPLNIFNFNDFDLLETGGGDTQDFGSLTQVRTHEGSIIGDAFAVGATAWEAGARNGVGGVRENFINGSVDDLSNAGTSFGPGEFASAFQWTTTLPGEGTQFFSASLVISSVPEPNGLGLVASGLSAVIGIWRRRRQGS